MVSKRYTWRWFRIDFSCSPQTWGNDNLIMQYFSSGWLNHQLDYHYQFGMYIFFELSPMRESQQIYVGTSCLPGAGFLCSKNYIQPKDLRLAVCFCTVPEGVSTPHLGFCLTYVSNTRAFGVFMVLSFQVELLVEVSPEN